MGNKYIIEEKELLSLLIDRAILECLEEAGVDNWSWYMYNKEDYLAEAMNMTPEEVEEKEIDFDDLAKTLLDFYEKI